MNITKNLMPKNKHKLTQGLELKNADKEYWEVTVCIAVKCELNWKKSSALNKENSLHQSSHIMVFWKIRWFENLRLCLLFFIFSPNDSPWKIMKYAFCFMEKLFLILEIFKVLFFFPSFFYTLSRVKGPDKK